MYRVINTLVIEQQPTADYPNRTKAFTLDFLNSYEVESTWANLTSTARIVIPNKIYFIDETGKKVNPYTAAFAPLFLRGDRVTLTAGYRYYQRNGTEKIDTATLFTGYISKVGSKTPIELSCEDNMWKLKQIQAPAGHVRKGTSIEDLLKSCLSGTGFTVSDKSSTTMSFDTGTLIVQNETVGQLLERINKEYHITSYFRGDVLHFGFPIYVEEDAANVTFKFQHNIIEDELEYNRKDDIVLGAKVVSARQDVNVGTTKDGKTKTRHKRVDVFVGRRGGNEITLFYPKDGGSEAELRAFGEAELKKHYYEGFRGSFTTFGIPYVKHGDNVTIQDSILPNREGIYKVKKVVYTGGMDGLRQTVHLDYKTTV